MIRRRTSRNFHRIIGNSKSATPHEKKSASRRRLTTVTILRRVFIDCVRHLSYFPRHVYTRVARGFCVMNSRDCKITCLAYNLLASDSLGISLWGKKIKSHVITALKLKVFAQQSSMPIKEEWEKCRRIHGTAFYIALAVVLHLSNRICCYSVFYYDKWIDFSPLLINAHTSRLRDALKSTAQFAVKRLAHAYTVYSVYTHRFSSNPEDRRKSTVAPPLFVLRAHPPTGDPTITQTHHLRGAIYSTAFHSVSLTSRETGPTLPRAHARLRR